MSKITDSTSFRIALEEGRYEEAVAWFRWLATDEAAQKQYGGKWRKIADDRGDEAFDTLRDAGEYVLAKQVVELTPDGFSKKGRRRSLEDTSGTAFDDIK